mmetsp:Transcript_9708/g.36072  ORF Transcript_9708/g.36072 Transcript_9708/m.36072 type:complete len:218 (-) Transcript_9708:1912-2565(-)
MTSTCTSPHSTNSAATDSQCAPHLDLASLHHQHKHECIASMQRIQKLRAMMQNDMLLDKDGDGKRDVFSGTNSHEMHDSEQREESKVCVTGMPNLEQKQMHHSTNFSSPTQPNTSATSNKPQLQISINSENNRALTNASEHNIATNASPWRLLQSPKSPPFKPSPTRCSPFDSESCLEVRERWCLQKTKRSARRELFGSSVVGEENKNVTACRIVGV